MSLGRLFPGYCTIWKRRGKESFIDSLEDIQWYEVSESSYYANRFPNFFINMIIMFLPSQIVVNEHSQVLYVVFVY